ncbi:hypothetical protein AB0H92_06830 [Streptomyces phaeochromogenes]|uniref:hypothetical protein n=1 Tax=Streptomyces phaeochromogenes TaxID=1923 RepID=UPI00340A2619
MTTGQMKYGETNDAGTDTTTLRADSTLAALDLGCYGAGSAGIRATGILAGVEGQPMADSGSGVVGRGPDAVWGFGVTGYARYGIGVDGIADDGLGVRGVVTKDGLNKYAVSGAALGRNSTAVVGVADDGPYAKAIVGRAKMGYAGYFHGRVRVAGPLYKPAGGFEIDHPLDPENRYLRHSFVESDKQLNVYSGTVVTDTEGVAVIQLPEYFEELNEDFRYQLTVVATTFAHAIVGREVHDNQFSVLTDQPEVKVSWQVSGVRRDRYARTYPFAAELDKSDDERGKYLYPETWGQPDEAGLEYAQVSALREINERLPVSSLPDRSDLG